MNSMEELTWSTWLSEMSNPSPFKIELASHKCFTQQISQEFDSTFIFETQTFQFQIGYI